MRNSVAVAVIHGVGKQTSGFSRSFASSLTARLKKRGCQSVFIEEICWQSVVEPLETRLLEDTFNLKWRGLRQVFLSYVGDAIAYQPVSKACGPYTNIHKKVDEGLSNLSRRCPPDTPLIFVSHSLGTIVASNFLWDCYNEDSGGRRYWIPSEDAVEIAKRMKLFYTLGSPLAVWSLGYPCGGSPVNIPRFCRWYNLFSPNDIIGYPIKVINGEYGDDNRIVDCEVDVGGLLSSWNPTSHMRYLEDKHFLNLLAEHISTI